MFQHDNFVTSGLYNFSILYKPNFVSHVATRSFSSLSVLRMTSVGSGHGHDWPAHDITSFPLPYPTVWDHCGTVTDEDAFTDSDTEDLYDASSMEEELETNYESEPEYDEIETPVRTLFGKEDPMARSLIVRVRNILRWDVPADAYGKRRKTFLVTSIIIGMKQLGLHSPQLICRAGSPQCAQTSQLTADQRDVAVLSRLIPPDVEVNLNAVVYCCRKMGFRSIQFRVK